MTDQQLVGVVYAQGATADAINQISKKIPDDDCDTALEIVGSLIEKIIDLAKKTDVSKVKPCIAATARWQKAARKSFYDDNKTAVDKLISDCRDELRVVAPGNLPLLNLARTVAVQTMLAEIAPRSRKRQ